MKELEFEFEPAPWAALLEALQPGQAISALQLLAALESEDDETVQEVLQSLEEQHITLDVRTLPADFGTGDTAVRLRREQQLVQSGTLLTALEENDPLRLYLEEIAMIPAAGDVQLLAQLYAQGDVSVQQRLVDLMISRVIFLAGEHTGRGVLLLDLIQEGSLGLWQGILSYTGGDFESHCDWWIRQYLAKAVMLQSRAGGVGQSLRTYMEDYRDTDQQLLTELGRNPTLAEIARQLHITEEMAQLLEQMMTAARTVQQIKAQQEPPEQSPEDDQAVEDTAYFQSRRRIEELLSSLSAEDAKLLTLRFGLEGGLPLNPQQTGERLGLTAEEMVSREAAALQQLRRQSGSSQT